MAEKDIQLGIIVLIAATFFAFSGLQMLEFEVFDYQFSMFLAFVLVGVGVYLITRK